MDSGQQVFTAIILAADREMHNPVAAAAGVRCKSMAPVNGTPMLFRVIEALASSGHVSNQILCGPPQSIMDQEPALKEYVTSGRVGWKENQATPSLSAFHAMASLPVEVPLLLTTSDHALLSPRIVDHFCREACKAELDVAAAVVRHEIVTAAYPHTRRTAYKFRDGAYCSCNLFAFMTPRSRQVPNFWRRVEQQRKNPLRVINILGWMTVFRYLLRDLTLAEVLDRLSRKLGCTAGVVVLPYPEAAIDVDSAEDWRYVQQIAAKTLS
jgi:GTP:adenosylcobinamide-phosphate guanylyltransferase